MERVRQAMEQALKQNWDQLDAVVPRDPTEVGPVMRPVVSEVNGSHEAKRPPSTLATTPAADTARSGPRWQDMTKETLVRNRLVACIAESPEREAFCLLQAAVSRYMIEHKCDSLGITSPRRSRGKTLTAVNLAISLALDGNRQVVLIDLDLEHPSVHECFGLEPSAGIEGCLFDGNAVENVLIKPGIERLNVLPSRGGSRQISRILRSPNLASLLTKLKRLYPDCLAIVDLPTVSDAADGEAFSSLVDAMLLVAENGVTRESDYRRSIKDLGKSRIVGTVLNKVD